MFEIRSASVSEGVAGQPGPLPRVDIDRQTVNLAAQNAADDDRACYAARTRNRTIKPCVTSRVPSLRQLGDSGGFATRRPPMCDLHSLRITTCRERQSSKPTSAAMQKLSREVCRACCVDQLISPQLASLSRFQRQFPLRHRPKSLFAGFLKCGCYGGT